MKFIRKVRALAHNPTAMRRFHTWAAVFWVVVGIPLGIVFRDSTPVLVTISIYAIVTGHWSSGQGAQADEYARPTAPKSEWRVRQRRPRALRR